MADDDRWYAFIHTIDGSGRPRIERSFDSYDEACEWLDRVARNASDGATSYGLIPESVREQNRKTFA
jgi:hypothetical protein